MNVYFIKKTESLYYLQHSFSCNYAFVEDNKERIKKMEIAGHEIDIKRDTTVKKEWYYCVLGVSRRKVIYGGSPEIVYRKALRNYKKGEFSFEESCRKINSEIDDKTEDELPF